MPPMSAPKPTADTAVLLAAYLVGTENQHHGQGSFSGRDSAKALYRELDNWIGMSPGLCR